MTPGCPARGCWERAQMCPARSAPRDPRLTSGQGCRCSGSGKGLLAPRCWGWGHCSAPPQPLPEGDGAPGPLGQVPSIMHAQQLMAVSGRAVPWGILAAQRPGPPTLGPGAHALPAPRACRSSEQGCNSRTGWLPPWLWGGCWFPALVTTSMAVGGTRRGRTQRRGQGNTAQEGAGGPV